MPKKTAIRHGGLDDPYFVDVTVCQRPEKPSAAKDSYFGGIAMRRAPPPEPVELPPIRLTPHLQPRLPKRSGFAYGSREIGADNQQLGSINDAGALTNQTQGQRRCLCCGAPANEVQHD